MTPVNNILPELLFPVVQKEHVPGLKEQQRLDSSSCNYWWQKYFQPLPGFCLQGFKLVIIYCLSNIWHPKIPFWVAQTFIWDILSSGTAAFLFCTTGLCFQPHYHRYFRWIEGRGRRPELTCCMHMKWLVSDLVSNLLASKTKAWRSWTKESRKTPWTGCVWFLFVCIEIHLEVEKQIPYF